MLCTTGIQLAGTSQAIMKSFLELLEENKAPPKKDQNFHPASQLYASKAIKHLYLIPLTSL